MPTVVRQDLDNTSAILTVTITREELKPKIDAELKRFRQKAPMKGFRPGQAPMEYIKKLYGASIFADTLNDVMTEELYGYLRDSKLDVLGQPLPTDDQEKFSFKINNLDPEYAVKYEIGFVPSIDLKGLDKSATFERITISNLNDLANEDLEYARKRMGKRLEVEDIIQENDMIKIEAKELDGDQVKDGGLETDMTFLVKSIADEAVKNQLLTLKKGDTLRYNARTLEGYDKEDMYRKYILNLDPSDKREVGDWFEGLIQEVTRVQDAEMDEEFFQNYFGNDAVTDKETAIEELKKGIVKFYDLRSDALLMRKFQESLIEQNRVELPEKFLKRWLLATNKGELTPETIENEFPAFAENLRWTIIRDEIKERFDVEVTDEELTEAFAQKIRNYFGGQAIPEHVIEASVKRLMENQKDVDDTRRDLEIDKLFKTIREQVTITEKAIPSEEFHKLIDAVSAKAQAEQEEAQNLL
ncbi:MAG: hypothetical protein JNJ57_16645 [Saprospiraceae bacterium]|nr:hypothetical protein [Saprospiraceae bacterium]